MEKKLKINVIIAITIIVMGLIILSLAYYTQNLTDLQKNYMKGFGVGILSAAIAILIKNISPLRSQKALRKREIELTDERLKEIGIRSMAITFKISLLIEALISATLAFTDNILGQYLGIVVWGQLIIYCITNIIVSRKI